MKLRLAREIQLADSGADNNPVWPILRVGTFHRGKVRVTSKDIDEIVASYDPKVERAAIDIDHETKGLAFGWVKSVHREGDTLMAEIEHLDAATRELIAEKRLRRPSVDLVRPHEVTGGLYLQGLALLGAKRAGVKGLEISLSEASEADLVLDQDAAGKPQDVPAYDVVLACLKALPDFVTPMLSGPIATSDDGALLADTTPEQRQVQLSEGITPEESARLRRRYPGLYGAAS